VVLVVPAWELTNKTARVYRELRPNEHSRVEDGERLASAVDSGARIPDDLVRNDLTGPAERVFPKLGELRRELRTVTGVEFLLCGAGPAVFHFSPSPTRAGEIGGAARRLGYPVFVARPLRGPTRIVEVAGRTASTEDHA
jgi:4-diphosphocytidyl-2C-methyl-D-erythritol kinase